MNQWIEGKWDGDHPVIPYEHNYVWFITDTKWMRMRPCHIESLDFTLLSSYHSNIERGEPPPRWWYIPIALKDVPDKPKELRKNNDGQS